MQQRPRSHVPRALVILGAALFALQLGWRSHEGLPRPQTHILAAPPSAVLIRFASLDEPIAAAGLLALRLQAFDNQPGISLPFTNLDYGVLVLWLARLLELDNASHYPLLMASHMYSQTPDITRRKQMLDFVYREFFSDPNTRWPYLAHAALIAKHELKDLPLALQYARAIQQKARGPEVPHWAQEMPIFILEDMGQLEAAKIELGALLATGSIRDPQESHFLSERYLDLQNRLSKPRQAR
mgnify:CR=1 FL=1